VVAIAIYRAATLIYNPYAGRLRGGSMGLVRRVADALAAAGHRVSALATKAPGDATRLARQAVAGGADVVLSLGGDGTLNEVLNGMARSDVPLGVIPAGTANVLARELDLGCDPLRAARRLAELEPRKVGAGLLHTSDQPSRYFMLMAGVGFDAHIVYNLHVPLKARLGQIAYWVGALREFGRRLDEFDAEVEGRGYRCSFALASRVRNYAGWLRIAREVSLADELFEIVLCEGTSTFGDYLRYLGTVLTGSVANAKGMCFLRAAEVSFSAPPDTCVYVQIDGEYAGRLPARVEVVHDAVSVLAPPGYFRT
jgi:YegS/Rv2252/BmrU family lipid kinase